MLNKVVVALSCVLLAAIYVAAHADTVTLPTGIEEVAVKTFFGDKALDEVRIPYGVKRILSKSFASSGVKRAYIPATVTYIAEDAFDDVPGLTIITAGGTYAAEYVKNHKSILWNDDPEAPMVSVSSKVVDVGSGEVLTGVTVKCGEHSIQTDRNGEFTLSIPMGGAYISFEIAGYLIQTTCYYINPESSLILETVRLLQENTKTMYFGHYEQDNYKDNGKEKIQWRILARDGDFALLLSEYGLDTQPYNKGKTNVTWETCTLRTWLNDDFLNEAFTQEEQSAIQTTLVDNGESQGWAGLRGWSESVYSVQTTGGFDTEDKVFLLSLAEVDTYFEGWERDPAYYYHYYSKEMATKPTDYAVWLGAHKDISTDNCYWLLRSPSFEDQKFVTRVDYDGYLGTCSVDKDRYFAVRPAIWVDLSAISD